jgi:hypothetical protein
MELEARSQRAVDIKLRFELFAGSMREDLLIES